MDADPFHEAAEALRAIKRRNIFMTRIIAIIAVLICFSAAAVFYYQQAHHKRSSMIVHYEGQRTPEKPVSLSDLSFSGDASYSSSQQFYVLMPWTDDTSVVDAVFASIEQGKYSITGRGPSSMARFIHGVGREDFERFLVEHRANFSSAPLIASGAMGGLMVKSER